MADLPTANTFSGTMDGLWKTIYGEGPVSLIPQFAMFQADVDFKEGYSTGEVFKESLVLNLEQGVTHAASGDGAFTLIGGLAGQVKKASINGSQIVVQGSLDYESAFSGDNSEKAFRNATEMLYQSMWETARGRVEKICLHGRKPLMILDTGSSATSLIGTAASWSDGLWAGMEGMALHVITSNGVTNHGAATVAESQINAINLATRTLTVGGAAATGMDTGSDAGVGDYVWARTSATNAGGGVVNKDAMGLDAILDPTVTTKFGLDTTSYSILKGNDVSAASGDLSFGLLNDGVAAARARGLDTGLTGYINPKAWANMMTDQAALRRYDSSQNSSKYVIGAESIEFFSANGKLTIKSHPYIKEGHALFFAPKLFKRVGATDLTFNRNAMGGSIKATPSFFLDLQTQAGYEIRCYGHQAPFTNAPARSFRVSSIVNS